LNLAETVQGIDAWLLPEACAEDNVMSLTLIFQIFFFAAILAAAISVYRVSRRRAPMDRRQNHI
jgi:hypothetical protein